MKKIAILLILTFLVFGASGVFAQPVPNQNGDGSGVGSIPVGGGVPIDGGLSILLVLGSAYGMKKAINKKKEE